LGGHDSTFRWYDQQLALVTLKVKNSVVYQLADLTYVSPMNDQDVMIGIRIREARQAAGLTQAQLAELVGVSRSAVAQWETGRTGQVGTNLTRIAACLGVPAGHLLEGSRTESSPMEGTEMALLRLYRACSHDDRAFLLRTAVRLARLADDGRMETVRSGSSGERPERIL
jgi:transcriptional regulator with XRE-family HTH domain